MPNGVTAAVLEIRSGGAAGRQIPLSARAILGRSASADVVLDHPSVSRNHAELLCDATGCWVLRDLDSRNGTTVNGVRIKQQALRDRDEIALGEIVLRLLNPERPGTAASSAEEDAPGFSVSSLDRMPAPRVSSEHVAAILDFGRSLQEAKRPLDRLRSLLELAVRREVGGWWAYPFRVRTENGNLQMRLLAEPANSALGANREPHVSRTVLRTVLQRGEPVVGNDLAKAQRFEAEMTVSPDAPKSSALACPIGKEGDSLDVLYVVVPPNMGTAEWLMFVSLAAEQYRHAEVAWAARSAAEVRAAIDRELELARHVQARTLPTRKNHSALDWAVRFDPCHSVAGDYIDVVSREDGSCILLVADAAGKGMQAALIIAGLHAVFHTQGRTEAPLPEVVGAADRYLRTFLPDGSFVTFTALLLDPTGTEGVCVNCGHPPMVAVNARGEVRSLEGGDNLPLGLCTGPVESQPVQIGPGEWVIGYTDGLSELCNADGKMLGIAGLHAQFSRLSVNPNLVTADSLAQALGDWLDEYRGPGPASDDRTLLVARRA